MAANTTSNDNKNDNDNAPEHVTAEKQGEVKIDKKAQADVVGGSGDAVAEDEKAREQNMEQAKADALQNAKADRNSRA